MLVLESDYDVHESMDTWSALTALASRIPTNEGVVCSTQEVVRLEGLPSFMEMFRAGAVKFSDFVGMRSHPATAEYRKWLWSQPDPTNAKKVASEYIRAITTKKAVDTTWYKVAKIFGINVAQTAIGAVVGSAVAGPAGMAVGTGIGMAMSAGENFLLDRLVRGVSPRRFAEEVLRPRFAATRAAPPPHRA